MKAVITGGAGFIGSNIVAALCARGDEVLVLDDLSSGYASNLTSHSRVRLIEGSILDEALVLEVLRGVEVVFHLAASVGNERSIREPRADARRNVLGTVNALEGCRIRGIRKIVHASSAGVDGLDEYAAWARSAGRRLMRVLILGGTGMLGHTMNDLLSREDEVVSTTRSAIADLPVDARDFFRSGRVVEGVDVTDLTASTDWSRASGLTRLSTCVGVIKQRDAAHDPAISIAVNALFPHPLAQICAARGARLVHFSTAGTPRTSSQFRAGVSLASRQSQSPRRGRREAGEARTVAAARNG